MLTNFLNKFRNHSTPQPSRSTQDFKLSCFHLGKNKDGQFFADPRHLDQLDDFKAHKQAADELNTHLALLAQVHTTVLALEGTEFDKNPREEIVAVTDFPLDGKSVTAVIRHYSETPSIDARVNDGGKTITILEEFGLARELKFSDGERFYKVKDKAEENYVSVELRAR